MWDVYGVQLRSRLLMGSAQFASPEILQKSLHNSGAEVVTVSLSRQMPEIGGGHDYWDIVKQSRCRVLPNTAGCYTVKDAVLMAQMAREIFNTTWIKLEIIGDDYTLHPDVVALCEAAKELISQGFDVFPYCTDDLTVCKRLIDCGCRVIMPGISPIGSGLGVLDMHGLRLLRNRYKDIVLIVDAGVGRPSDASVVMEQGIDGVLLNSAVARAIDPSKMASAFKHAIESGRLGYEAGIINKRDLAVASTNLVDTPFWHRNKS
ncbi:thiazole synthase [Anaplasma phagocytophilum]|uniref:thiazole synthase n=1 Tax=Anaplasma phagocytophilum TaxID=948 RepID=UPI00201A9EB0